MAFEVGTSSSKGVRPSINVTPLVDVVLVLLIIFMVVTPLLSKQFRLQVPEKIEADTAPVESASDTAMVLSVDDSDQIRINSDLVAKENLAAEIGRLFAKRQERVVFFTADDSVPFGRAMELVDIARAGGAESIAMLTEKIELNSPGSGAE